MEFTAQRFNLHADIFHHLRKIVGAHMRILLVGYRLGRAMLIKLVEYKLIVFAIDVCVEFAIGKSAGTALTELHVGIGVQHFGLQETLHRLLPLLDALAPLDNHGMGAATGEIKGSEHPRRPETDHHRRQVVRPFGIGKFLGGNTFRSIGAFQQGTILVGNGDFHLEIVQHVVFLPCIHRLAHDTETVQILRTDFELLTNQIFNVFFVPDRNLYIR